MTICGTTHSCKLRPPWLYSSPAMKQSIPGGQATRTSSAQNQEKQGSSTVARGLHHGTAAPAGRRQELGQIGLRQALGHQQPAVVGDDADFLPSGLQQRLDALHQARQSAPGCGGPVRSLRRGRSVSRLPNSVQALPFGSPVSLVGEVLHAVFGQELAESIRRQVFAVQGHAGAEFFAGDRPFDFTGHRRNGGLRGRRHGRQRDELMAGLNLDRSLWRASPGASGPRRTAGRRRTGRRCRAARRASRGFSRPGSGVSLTRFWNSSAASRSQGL